jgi:hypothetical protein
MSLVEESMTRLADIPGLHWDRQAWEDFTESDRPSQDRMIATLALAAGPPATDYLKTALPILEALVGVFGGVGTIAGGVEAIRAVIKG